MPKIVVVVEKDQNGRLWDYFLHEKNILAVADAFGTKCLQIHQYPSLSNGEADGEERFLELSAYPAIEEKQKLISNQQVLCLPKEDA
jgi:hypothetical protein